MLAALDVAYAEERAAAACVSFAAWSSEHPAAEHCVIRAVPGEYVPGRFFERELPCLLAVLEALGAQPEAIVVDGYVWLDGPGKPGLGAHLFDSIGGTVPVIGVAKNPFTNAHDATSLLRGDSDRPLFVSAAGLSLEQAVRAIATMHGPYRIPTLLRRVDRLARERLETAAQES